MAEDNRRFGHVRTRLLSLLGFAFVASAFAVVLVRGAVISVMLIR